MSLDIHFHQRIVKKLKEETDEHIQNLASGALDHERYKDACGYLRALRDIAAWCQEVSDQLEKGR